jgi:hypothetical protein
VAKAEKEGDLPSQPQGLAYKGIAYRQSRDQSAPWIVTFVCPAEELTTWAGIPQRTDQIVLGFQRPEDDIRVLKAKRFFDLGINQSPTAIVVGLHPPVGEDARVVSMEFLDTDETLPIRPCRLVVQWDSTIESDTSEVIRRIKRQLTARFAQSQAGDEEEAEESEVTATGNVILSVDSQGTEIEEPEEESEEEESEEDAAGDEEEIELGRSLIKNLLSKLDDPA